MSFIFRRFFFRKVFSLTFEIEALSTPIVNWIKKTKKHDQCHQSINQNKF